MKSRAHLLVERACLLKGALDETGFFDIIFTYFVTNVLSLTFVLGILSYGEVFIQYSRPHSGNIIMEGRVAVAKNPCLHPGDIRILNAGL